MKPRSVMRVVTMLVCLAVLAGAVRSQPVGPSAPRVKMTLRALATPMTKPSFENASSGVVLSVGESGDATFSTMSDLCTIAAGGSSDRMSRLHHLWIVRFTLVSVQIDKIAVDVTMDRRDDHPRTVKRETRHLVLTEGAPHVLDFVETNDSPCGVRNIVLEVNAAFEEAPAFAREMVSYDLWLTHRDPTGREWTRHEDRSARQGERVDFRFRPVTWTLDALVAAGDRETTINEHVFGAIRGRIRTDGRIDVSFQVNRDLALGQGSIGEAGGHKIFVVHSGEPVRIELPPASGQSDISLSNGTPTRVDYSQVFGGHTTAVVVKVDRLP